MTQQHAISVVPHFGLDGKQTGFRWYCKCDASGNVHHEHQTALEFGLAHLQIEIEREGGQA